MKKTTLVILLTCAIVLFGSASFFLFYKKEKPLNNIQDNTSKMSEADTVRSLVIAQKDVMSTSSISILPHDFNNDGQKEYVVTYEKIFPQDVENGGGAYFVVYQKDENKWNVIDESMFGDPVVQGGRIISDPNPEILDIDKDGSSEVKIVLPFGRGNMTYLLKWDNNKIMQPRIVQSMTYDELVKKFLKNNEEFAWESLGSIDICLRNSDCDGFPVGNDYSNPLGVVVNDFVFKDHQFIATNYRRENF